MKIRGLHHAQITIPEGQEMQGRAFYCGLLGLLEKEKPESLAGRGGFWLQVGEREVHVGTESAVDRTRTRAHLAYEVDDLQAWRRHLAANGVAIKESIPVSSHDRFEIRDPFGNRIEFIQPV